MDYLQIQEVNSWQRDDAGEEGEICSNKCFIVCKVWSRETYVKGEAYFPEHPTIRML